MNDFNTGTMSQAEADRDDSNSCHAVAPITVAIEEAVRCPTLLWPLEEVDYS